MITSITLLIGLIISILGFIFKVRNEKLNYVIRLIHMAFLFLTVLCILLFIKKFSFRGFYTNRIIVSIWFGTGIALFGLYRKGSINLLSRLYYGLLFWTPIFFLVAWFIPRLHFMAAVFGLGLAIDGDATRFPIEKKYQLQEAFQGVLASSRPSLDLVGSFGIFEKTTKAFIYRPSADIEKINFTRLSNDSVKIHIVTNKNGDAYSDTTIQLPK